MCLEILIKNISNLIDGKANERIVKIVLNYEI